MLRFMEVAALEIAPQTTVAEVVRHCPTARRIFDSHGLKGCGGEHGPEETLSFFASVHGVALDTLLRELGDEIAHPSQAPYIYRASVADSIYRPFFKAGIATVLSIGCMWGAINLLQIALGGTFLQLGLLPAIHAHAHAMIWGWVGVFVMGFAYQSFPRFKNTTLWRPGLARLTFFLVIAGIVTRAVAELTQPASFALALGAFSAAVEITAAVLFITILVHTARQSCQLPAAHEKFIFGAMFWFLVQSLLSPVFFFAKATAATQDQLVMRIAAIDGPLRDIQLLGFALLIIAGVSQRLIPTVYGLPQPRRNRQSLIFVLMNASLMLNVASYLLLLTTQQIAFAAVLELAYLLMPVWAVLLVRQLRIFAEPAQLDRSFKFIRAAYIWLLVACFMMPLFPLYSFLTGQVFAHSFIGAQRHAFTVGFISMMILGVSARVVPILAGVSSERLDSLILPFVLINVGNAGRVSLQILTDWIPSVAYPLVGLTGFIEVTALVWWGIGLWRIMSQARAPQSMKPALVTISR